MTRRNPDPRTLSGMSSMQRKIRTRSVVATLLLIVGALAVRVTMLDDSWLRLVLAGGDRIGLLAKERHIRLEVDRAAKTSPAVELSAPEVKGTSPPVSAPEP